MGIYLIYVQEGCSTVGSYWRFSTICMLTYCGANYFAGNKTVSTFIYLEIEG